MVCWLFLTSVTVIPAPKRNNFLRFPSVRKFWLRRLRWKRSLETLTHLRPRTKLLSSPQTVKVLKLASKRNVRPIKSLLCRAAWKVTGSTLIQSTFPCRRISVRLKTTMRTRERTYLTASKKLLNKNEMSTLKKCWKTLAVSTSFRCKRKRNA